MSTTKTIQDLLSQVEDIQYQEGDTPLEDVEGRTKALETALDHLHNAAAVYLADKREHRNKFVPISNLPCEVFGQILQLDLPSPLEDEDMTRNSGVSMYYERLTELRLVCRSWRRVIESTHSLWAYCPVFCTTELWNRIILRSGEHPLRLYLHKPLLDQTGRTPFAVIGREGLLQNHFARIGVLSLHLERTGFEFYLKYVERSHPLVTHMILDSRYYGSQSGRSVNLFNGDAPRLRALSLRDVLIPIHSPLLSALHSLMLRSPPGNTLTLSDLWTFLRNCTQLKSLKLESFFGAISQTSNDDSQRAISLPNLERLELHLMPVFIVMGLLSRLLPLPRCRHIALECDRYHEYGKVALWRSSSSSSNSSFKDILAALMVKCPLPFRITSSLELKVKERQYVSETWTVTLQSAPGSHTTCQLSFRPPGHLSMFSAINPLLLALAESSSSSPLEVVLPNFDPEIVERLSSVARSLPVVSLSETAVSDIGDYQVLYRILSEMEEKEGLSRPKFGDLKRLEVVGSKASWLNLLAMLRARFPQGSRDSTCMSLSGVFELELSYHRSDPNHSVFSEIRAIIGDQNLILDPFDWLPEPQSEDEEDMDDEDDDEWY